MSSGPARLESEKPPPALARWAEQAWSQCWRRLCRAGSWNSDDVIFRFSQLVRKSRNPDDVRSALVALARRITGASRVELELEEVSLQTQYRAACWPPDEPWSRPRLPGTEPYVLSVPLIFEGRRQGTLRLISQHRRRWSQKALRRIEVLCVLAAAGELRSGRWDSQEATRDPETGAYNNAFSSAFVSHALARARRHAEPLTMILVEFDQALGWDEQNTADWAVVALARAARAMIGTLRASDVVARLGPARLGAILSNSAAEDGIRVARALRKAIGEAELASGVVPTPTVSLGVAVFPNHAREPGPLLAAAAEALARAQAAGPGNIASALPIRSSQLALAREQ